MHSLLCNKKTSLFHSNKRLIISVHKKKTSFLFSELFLVSLAILFFTSCSSDDRRDIPPIDIDSTPNLTEEGWTVFKESEDTRKIYVSSSTGIDTNDGLSESSPKKTVDAGVKLLRDNMPDWLLFKRGDQWDEIGGWRLSGRSDKELMLISSYGEGLKRPQFAIGLTVTGGGNTPEVIKNVAFVGLAVIPEARNPKNPTNTATVNAINWLRGAKNILFEDCFFRWAGISLQDFDGFGIDNVTFRRTHFLDSYSVKSHAQGLFVEGVTNFTLDECIFDHNGWAEELAEAEPNQFNHNIYYQYGSDESFTIKNSILSRGSSHGMQLRSGGRVENNLFMENAINILIGSGDKENNIGGVTGWVIDNVILDATDIRPRKGHLTDPMLRGWALSLENINTITITGNIASNSLGGFSSGLLTDAPNPHSGGVATVTRDQNITIGYGKGEDHNEIGPFVDADRNIKSYMKKLGLTGGLEEFMLEARKQQKGNWREKFTVTKVNEYIREGFKTP